MSEERGEAGDGKKSAVKVSAEASERAASPANPML